MTATTSEQPPTDERGLDQRWVAVSVLLHACLLVLLLGLLPQVPPPEEKPIVVRVLMEAPGAAGAAGGGGGEAGGAQTPASSAPAQQQEQAQAAAEAPQEPTPPAEAPPTPPTPAAEPVPTPAPALEPTPKPTAEAVPEPPPPHPPHKPVHIARAVPQPTPPVTEAPPAPPVADTGARADANRSVRRRRRRPAPAAGPAVRRAAGKVPKGRARRCRQSRQRAGRRLSRALLRWIPRYKKYPPDAIEKKEEGEVTVGFVLARDGTVLDAWIERSSGVPALDAATLAMMHRASPVPPVPDRYKGEKLTLSMPIDYRIGMFQRLFR